MLKPSSGDMTEGEVPGCDEDPFVATGAGDYKMATAKMIRRIDGPVFYAGTCGLRALATRLSQRAALIGDESMKPAPLLAKLAAQDTGSS